METGSLRADKDTGTCYSDGLGNLSTKADSQVFDLVIDPLTDFKVRFCSVMFVFLCITPLKQRLEPTQIERY